MKKEGLLRIVEVEFEKRHFDPMQVAVNCYLRNIPQITYADKRCQFTYAIDFKQGICYNGNIIVEKDQRGQGIGRELVKVKEAICKKLHIPRIIINHNSTPRFWKQMGYEPMKLVDQAKFWLQTKRSAIIQKPYQKEL